MSKPVPVILDTDIGYDIDDTWALAMLLKSPEVDLRLVVSDTHDTTYSAKLLAKMLTVAGRTDIPVGIGIRQDDVVGGQAPWVQDYALDSYAGEVHQDGVSTLIAGIMDAPEPVTLLCIGPVPNIAEALRREPRIAARARFVGMHGSVRRGYDGSAQISAEYNVHAFPRACAEVFAAPWRSITITPLDTCGVVVLRGEKYRQVRDCGDPVTQALIGNYRHWAGHGGRDPSFAEERSTTLFDTVAAYLSFSEELLVIEELGLRVTEDGHTLIDATAKKLRCATEWRNLAAYEDFLVRRLTER